MTNPPTTTQHLAGGPAAPQATTNQPRPRMDLRHDKKTILAALSILCPSGVVELRALDTEPGSGYDRTVSGYFDQDHHEALADAAIRQAGGAAGVYITLQEIKEDCLARACNRARPIKKKDPTTSDADVVGYRWLPLDFDPKKPAGVSSSDAEHALAHGAARLVTLTLCDEGWPAPVYADSGNGAHVLYKLPEGWAKGGDGEKIKAVLAALIKRFPFEGVDLDAKVFNPARIWKLPGTVARKGDGTPSRPHRISRLLDVPPTVEAVAPELLDALVIEGMAILNPPKPAPKPKTPTPVGQSERAAAEGSKPAPQHEPDSREKVEDALSYIPADDRDTWLHVGAALHHWGEPDARFLWDDWSSSSAKCEAREQDKAWASFKDDGRSGRVRTLATVYKLAQENGWEHPSAKAKRERVAPKSNVVKLQAPAAAPIAVPEVGAAVATITQINHQDPQARIFGALESVVAIIEAEGDDSILALTTWADALGVVAEVWPALPPPRLPPSVLLSAVGPQPMERIEVWQRRSENAVATFERRHTKPGFRVEDDKASDFLRAASSKDARVEAELGAYENPWRVALAWTMRADGDEQTARAKVLGKLLENFGQYVKPDGVKPTIKAMLPAALWPMLPEAFAPKPKKTKTPEEKARAKNQGTVRGCLPDAPIVEGASIPEPWAIRCGVVGKVSKDEEGDERFVEVARVLLIVAGQEDAMGERWVTLAFKHWGRWRTKSVPRIVICDRNKLLGELPSCGADVNSNNAGTLVEWLAAFENANDDVLPRSKVSPQMGWQGPKGARGFLLGETWIGADGPVEARSDDPNTWREGAWALAQVSAEDSRDALKFSAQREGTLEGWVETVAKAVKYPRVMFALYASLSAPLIRILGTRSPIVDWSGPPGTGKTSTLRLASSVWGSPREDGQDGGPIGTWNGTIVAHERRAALLGNLPLMLNDSNKAPDWIPGKVIYELAEGAGKQRGAGGGGRQASQQWATTILSNGEQRLIDLASVKDAGTAHRVISLHGSPWGGIIREEFLEDFRDGLDANHGHMGRYWVDWLVRYLAQPGFESHVKEGHRNYKRALSKQCKGNPAANRFAEDFAAFMLTITLVHEAFNLPWDQDKMLLDVNAVFLEVAAGAVGLATHERALHLVWDWATANTEQFWGRRDAERGEPNQGWAGAWRGHDGWTEIAFRPGAVAAILEKHGLKVESVERDWVQAGWLRKDGKHSKPKVAMGDTSPRLICIKRDAIERVCMGVVEPAAEEAAEGKESQTE